MKDRMNRADEEWRQLFTPGQYEVICQKGTEPPFTGEYHNFKENGV